MICFYFMSTKKEEIQKRIKVIASYIYLYILYFKYQMTNCLIPSYRRYRSKNLSFYFYCSIRIFSDCRIYVNKIKELNIDVKDYLFVMITINDSL